MRAFGKVLKNVKIARSFKSVRSARNATFLRKNVRFFKSFGSFKNAKNGRFVVEFSANFSANFKSFFSDFFENFASFLTFKSSVKSASFCDFERFFSVLFVKISSVFRILKNGKNAFKFREVFEKIFRIFGKNVFKFFDYFKFLVFVVFVKFFKYFKKFRVFAFKFFRVFERESGYG